MINMITNEAPLKGYEWCQVSEMKFIRFTEENFLVRQSNGRVRKYYDCTLDAITAIAEVHTEDTMYYIQRKKK